MNRVPSPRRARVRPVLLCVVVLSAVFGWRAARERITGEVSAERRAAALARVPQDWLVVQAAPAELGRFVTRLPNVKAWMATADEFERQNPPSAAERELEKLFDGTRATVFAASPSAVARGVYSLGLLGGNPFAFAPGDLDAMVKQLEFQERLRRAEPESGSLSLKPGAYRPARRLPAAGDFGGTPAWRAGETYFAEPEPGLLVSGENRAGVARLVGKPPAPPAHPHPPKGVALMVHVNPEFWRADVWGGSFAKFGAVRVAVTVAADGLGVELRATAADDAQLAEWRQFSPRPDAPPPPWMKNPRTSVDGREFVLRFDLSDETANNLIPTPNDVKQQAEFLDAIRRVFGGR